MSGFARLLGAACVAAALTCSASAPAPAATPAAAPPAPVLDLAALDDADALAAQRVLLRRRDCSKWWTCGPFKRDKPRLA